VRCLPGTRSLASLEGPPPCCSGWDLDRRDQRKLNRGAVSRCRPGRESPSKFLEIAGCFPGSEIAGHSYWDGGLWSNTPLNSHRAVCPPRSSSIRRSYRQAPGSGAAVTPHGRWAWYHAGAAPRPGKPPLRPEIACGRVCFEPT
jgi:hypothetical protein